ncbi:hypothetical protein [Nocardia sp. alder85J]|nr:hypothetical protein [Nocardia sp. alder85J]MCX4091852.1 hypothetical protein [Nocardia sp. alder85J]
MSANRAQIAEAAAAVFERQSFALVVRGPGAAGFRPAPALGR